MVAEIDPFEMMDAKDILSKLPKDYYEKIVSVFICVLCTYFSIYSDC